MTEAGDSAEASALSAPGIIPISMLIAAAHINGSGGIHWQTRIPLEHRDDGEGVSDRGSQRVIKSDEPIGKLFTSLTRPGRVLNCHA